MPRRSRSSWRIDPRAAVDFFTVNWALKLTALVLAFLLWSMVKAEEPDRITIDNVPIRVENRDGNWIMTEPPVPQTVSVVVSGPSRELLRLAFDRPDIFVPMEDVKDSTEVVVLRNTWVRMFKRTDNTRVEDVQPDAVQLTFDRVSTRLVPLAVDLTGSLVAGFEIEGPVQIEPSAVRVSGPSRRVNALDSLRLPPLDLSRFAATDTVFLAVDTTGLGVLVAPPQVQVILTIAPLGSDSAARRRSLTGPPPQRRGGP
ncbi:MAG: CdaR family protein [Longimicrobiales bacterium]